MTSTTQQQRMSPLLWTNALLCQDMAGKMVLLSHVLSGTTLLAMTTRYICTDCLMLLDYILI